MEAGRDDFIIAIRSVFLKKDNQQRFSLIALITFSLIFLILGKLNFPRKTKTIEKNNKPNNENLCLLPFFKKAERIAIIKSSLLGSIFFIVIQVY